MITPKIAPWKKDRVQELTDILNSDGVVGIVDVGGVPAGNMLDMRSNLRDSMKITMAKKTLIKLAWEKFWKRYRRVRIATRKCCTTMCSSNR